MIGKETALVLTILALTIGGTVALADSGNKPSSAVLLSETEIVAQRVIRQGERRGDKAEKLIEQLDLSDEQVQQLNTIRQKYASQLQPLRERIRATAEELRTMMQGEASDTALRMKHKEMASLRQKMGDLRFESMIEMRKVLTPQQRQEFAQLMQQRRQRGGWNRGNQESTP